jgi:hypothetical protein
MRFVVFLLLFVWSDAQGSCHSKKATTAHAVPQIIKCSKT